MTNKIEMTGKKAANIVIKSGCFAVSYTASAIEMAAGVGELACWGIRMGAEYIEEKADDIIRQGGIFHIDEEESRDRAEEILAQYV